MEIFYKSPENNSGLEFVINNNLNLTRIIKIFDNKVNNLLNNLKYKDFNTRSNGYVRGLLTRGKPILIKFNDYDLIDKDFYFKIYRGDTKCDYRIGVNLGDEYTDEDIESLINQSLLNFTGDILMCFTGIELTNHNYNNSNHLQECHNKYSKVFSTRLIKNADNNYSYSGEIIKELMLGKWDIKLKFTDDISYTDYSLIIDTDYIVLLKYGSVEGNDYIKGYFKVLISQILYFINKSLYD